MECSNHNQCNYDIKQRRIIMTVKTFLLPQHLLPSKNFYYVCLLVFLSLLGKNVWTRAEATHQLSISTDSNGAMIFVDIPSWKNRTAYPRFLYFRDNLRRRLDADSDSSEASTTYSTPSQTTLSAITTTSSEIQYEEITPTVSYTSEEKTSTLPPQTEDYDYNDEDLFQEHLQLSNRNNFGPVSHTKAISNNANRDSEKLIHFPKDRTNPYNRLQIYPEDEGPLSHNISKLQPQPQPSPQSQELANSLETGNRETLHSHVDREVEKLSGKVDGDVKDAVPTFDLTMKIIELSRWREENVVFSPLSIANVLSMLLLGSNGETFEELSALLDKHHHLNSSEWDILRYHEAFRKLNHYFKHSSGKGVDFTTASELFVDKRFQINENYRKELESYYGARIESFNFERDGEIFKDRINKWVREQTHNQIRSILEEAPSTETVLGIINAIYFKGPWEFPFNEKYTTLREFRMKTKEKLKVQMMVNELKIPYIERDSFRMTTLPYKDNKTALFLILPKGNDGINDLKNVEKSLTTQLLNESIYHMDDQKVTIFLPKLKFSSNGQMKEILQSMGLSSLFTAGRSDLTGISNTSDLYLTSVVHRAVIEINEKGTEASAVTLGTVDRIFEEPPIPFICDKPFIFFIYHVEADTIIFWGRVTKPESIPPT